MASKKDPLVGSIVIPEYVLSDFTDTEIIGEGGEATVHRAHHVKQKTIFALKIIHRNTNPLASSNSRIDIKEAEILIQYSMHSNIARVYGLLVEDGRRNHIGYVMEFMEYKCLKKTIHNPEINYDMNQFYSWIRQAANGLKYLHDHEIIHRDIKPANFLLGHSLDDLKISDFGLAKSLSNPVSNNIPTGGIGTTYYMSPEVIGFKKYSFPSDIYALSITIWEMFHRKDPYEKYAENHYQIITEVLNNNLRPTMTIGSPLNNLLKRGWDAVPEKRPGLTEFIDFASSSFEQNKKTPFLYVGKDSEEVLTYPSHSEISPISQSEILQLSKLQQELNPSTSIILLGGWHSNVTDSICLFNSKEKKWINSYLKLPDKLGHHGSVILNDEIYICGGYNRNECVKSTDKLEENGEWIELADMNEKRTGIRNSSVVFEDEIWVFGGRDGTKRLKTVEKYNKQRNIWIKMPEMNEARSSPSVSIINGKFYVSGGFGGNSWFADKYLDTIEVYDPEKNKCEMFCNMPIALYGHALIVDGTNLIIIGGRKSNGQSSDEVWKIDVMNPKKEWKKMPNLQQPRYYHGAVKLEDELMVIGGSIDDATQIDSVEIFDGQKWKQGPKLPKIRGCFSLISELAEESKTKELFMKISSRLDVIYSELNPHTSVILLGGRHSNVTDSICLFNSKENKWVNSHWRLPYRFGYHGSVILNDEIYIFGGWNGNECVKSTYKLEENGEWIKLADMNEKRNGFQNSSVVFEDEIWVFGGRNDTYRFSLRTVEKYNKRKNTWTMMSEMEQRRNVSAVSIINGKFYVSGGFGGNSWFADKYLDTIEVYDPAKNKCEMFCILPLALANHTSIADDTNLIIIGGLKSDGKLSDEVWKIDVMDPKKKWKKMPNLQQPRFWHGAVKLEDGLMVIGGSIDDATQIDSVEIFDGQRWKQGPNLLEIRGSFSLIPLANKNENIFLQKLCIS